MIDFIGEVATIPSGKHALYRQHLVGEQQYWVNACLQAVNQQRDDWLTAYLSVADPDEFPWPLGPDDPLFRHAPPRRDPERDVFTAQAIAACAAAALQRKQIQNSNARQSDVIELAMRIVHAATIWQRGRMEEPVPDLPGPPDQALIARMCETLRWTDTCWQQMHAMLELLHHHFPNWEHLGAVRDLILYFVLGGEYPPSDRTVTVLVPLDLGEIGVISRLQLDVYADGLGEYYPDPALLAFFNDTDANFRRALAHAWEYVHHIGLHDGRSDVRWRLTIHPREAHPSTYLDQVKGDSIGAGFALALLHLLDPQREPLDLAQSKWAITGAVAVDAGHVGEIRSVSGYRNKLPVALEGHLKVIVPAADADPPAFDPVWFTRLQALEGAATIDQAAEIIATYVDPSELIIPSPQKPRQPRDITGFVGRADELSRFAHKLGTSHLALITGLPGVGKTWLAARLVQHLTQQHVVVPDKVFWHGFRDQEDETALEEDTPIDPQRVFWHEFYRHDGVAGMIRKLAEFLAYYGEPEHWQRWHRLQVKDVDSQKLISDIFQPMLGYIISQGGYLICLDDLWHVEGDPLLDVEGDPLLHDVVTLLYREAQNRNLWLIMTSRWKPNFLTTIIGDPLHGFALADTQRLLTERKLTLADDLIAKLHQKVHGNVQLLTLAVNVLSQARNPAKEIDCLADADDIGHYLLHEVDNTLNEEQCRLMKAVSVLLGQPGTRRAVAAILDTRQGIGQTLNELTGRYLLIRADKEYRQHDIVRDFYYSQMEENEEEELFEMHHRAGAYYETSENEHDLLRAATHFERAGEHAHAASLVVGDHVWPIIRQGQAHSLQSILNRLMARTLNAPLNVDVPIAHGEAASFLRQVEAAETSYRKALALLTQLPDEDEEDVRERKLRLCYGMATLLELHRPYEALDWVVQGLEQVTEPGTLAEARLLLRKGSVLIKQHKYPAARETLEQVLHLFPESASDWRVRVLINLAANSYYQGMRADARQFLLQARDICEQTENDLDMCAIKQNLGILLQNDGEWAAAAEEQRAIPDLAKRLGDRSTQTAATLSLGILCKNQGQVERAREYLMESVELSRRYNLDETLVRSLSSLADLHIRLEAWDIAEQCLAEAEHLLQQLNTLPARPEISRGWAHVTLAQGQTEQALKYAEQAVRHGIADTTEEEGRSQRVLGIVLAAMNQHAQAYQALQRSLALLESVNPYEAARTRAAWAQILCASGSDQQQATSLIQEAQATFARLGAQRDLDLVTQLQ